MLAALRPTVPCDPSYPPVIPGRLKAPIDRPAPRRTCQHHGRSKIAHRRIAERANATAPTCFLAMPAARDRLGAAVALHGLRRRPEAVLGP